MPKTKHDRLKWNAAQIYLGLERVMADTLELKGQFDPFHPELAAALGLILDASLASQELLRKFWAKAWGQESPRWKSWI